MSSSSPKSLPGGGTNKLLNSIRIRRSPGPGNNGSLADTAAKNGMYSTPAESYTGDLFASTNPSGRRVSMSRNIHKTTTARYARTRVHSAATPDFSTRPTIEQIAMGLHVSRTPHLRTPPEQYSHAHRTNGAPSRSSLKKPYSSESTSTVDTQPCPSPYYASISSNTTPALSIAESNTSASSIVSSSNPSTPKSFVARISSRFRTTLVTSQPVSRSSSLDASELGLHPAATADSHATIKPRATQRKAVRFG